ncbi:LssY C-terminal domain-containing protein [Leifsonia xyli]|uniref:LssY C-terminal domain-containing protein n=1 Tax=Leifsonia xyli TaxID=1575 RepID=UPI003D66A674
MDAAQQPAAGPGHRTRLRKDTLRYGIVLVATIVLTGLNALVLRYFDLAGLPSVFGLDLVVQVLLIVLLLYSLAIVLRTPATVLWSIVVSASRGIEQNEYVRRADARAPWLLPWLKRRFATDRPTGLALTIGVVVTTVLLVLFLNLIRAVASGAYLAVDERVVSLMPSLRTPAETRFFAFFTFAAGFVGILFFIAVLTVAALVRRRWWLPVLFAVAYGLETLCSDLTKLLVHRPRPDQALHAVAVAGFSFPSGHVLSATVVYGLAAYVAFRSARSSLVRVLIVLLAVAVVLLVGISRVYFGVHYPTDVAGAALLGGAILAVLISVVEITQRFRLVPWWSVDRADRGPVIVAAAVTALFAAIFSGPLTPVHSAPATTAVEELTSMDARTLARFPHYSETLTGDRMEPVSLVFVGSRGELENAFRTAGWYQADSPTVGNSLRELLTAARNEQYLTAPVTPAYLDAKPQDLAFEKPTGANTLQQRHHTRIWRLPADLNGQPVWVATASLDRGVGIGSQVPLPTHHIDPDVDAERSYLLRSLGVEHPSYVRVVRPQLGHNAGGDAFFTDGRAAVVPLGGR